MQRARVATVTDACFVTHAVELVCRDAGAHNTCKLLQDLAGNSGESPLEMVFIRGPVIERVGPGVEVLAEYAGKPALVRKGRVMAAAFHPELTDDTTVHDRFVKMAAEKT